MGLKAKNLIELQHYCSEKDVTGSLVQSPAESRVSAALGPLKPPLLQPEAAPFLHPLLTQCAPASGPVWLPPLDSLQLIVVFLCMDAVLQAQSHECGVKGHNPFAPALAPFLFYSPICCSLHPIGAFE